MRRVRIIFWAHVTVALYCVTCGLLDLTGHFRQWMIPSNAVFYALVLSALLFPAAALGCVLASRVRHRVLLLFTHAAISIAQLFLGLLPLYS